MDWGSFGYGSFATAIVIAAVGWLWYRYAPQPEAKDQLPGSWKPPKESRR